ncbi:hypothetical protein BKA65DRAFT_561809 [Rhexocercosporidium sp. MPI-PUGE-AT-0058]|nr:hypothetical protein BKA65DRAFT_561809 [Rhexocercosporidium sp. MPI-PUGE-AT-0058]
MAQLRHPPEIFLNNWPPLLLLLSLAPPATAALSATIVLKPSYQSKDISFSDWVSLFTLCLTPLIVHIIVGTPEVVCLSSTRKYLNWHRRFCHYNPTTILWRYFAIVDRRVREKEWSTADLAASNALFWTTRGWDGSEELIQSSRIYCLKFPDKPRATIFSKNFVKTVVVTTQGVQPIMDLLQGINGNTVFMSNVALDKIFFPLAVIGLVRLFAAPWLTEDYFYAEHEDRSTTPALKQRTARSQTIPNILEARTTSSMGLVDPADYAPEARFHPVNSWRGRFFRVIFLIPISILWAICIMYTIPGRKGGMHLATTYLLFRIFYMSLLSGTLFIHVYYFIRDAQRQPLFPALFLPVTRSILASLSLWYLFWL